jgi:hypothetical protein
MTIGLVGNSPPNRPPTGVFLVPKLSFLAKIFAVYSRSCGRRAGYEPGGRRFESCRAHHKIKRSKHLRRSVAGLRRRLDLLVSTQAIEAESGTEDHSHAAGNPVWRAVFLGRYLFVRRVKLPRSSEALGCRRDFPGAEYLIAVTNREDEGLHREVVAAHLAHRPSF